MRRIPFLLAVLAGCLGSSLGAQDVIFFRVGALREAFLAKRPLVAEYQATGQRYQILDLIDTLPNLGPSEVIHASHSRYKPGVYTFLFQNAPRMDPSTGMPMPGTGGPGVFSGTLQLLPPEEAKGPEAVPSRPQPTREADSALGSSSSTSSSSSTVPQGLHLPSGALAGFTVAPLPLRPEPRMAALVLHSLHDARTGLYLGMEKVSDRTATFWRQRLALDAHLLLDKFTFTEKERAISRGRSPSQDPEFQVDDLGHIRGIRAFTRLGKVSFEGYHPQVDPRYQGLYDLHLRFAPQDLDPAKLRDYLSAWKGFLWNLDNPEDATWVAYLSTQPVTGLLCDQPDGDVTTAIKMVMTVQITDGIYCPLGIYACPTGLFADQAKNLKRGPLAMFLHAGVARLVDEVNPGKVDLAVLRPIASMRTLLEKSGIPFRMSPGFVDSGESFRGEVIVEEVASPPHPDLASLGLHGQGLLLVDPLARRIHTLARNHWFARSPFLGQSNHDRELMAAYPYFFIRRQDLARDLHAGMPRTDPGKEEGKAEGKAPPVVPTT